MRKVALHIEESDGRTIRINVGAVRMDTDELTPDVLTEIACQILKIAIRKYYGTREKCKC